MAYLLLWSSIERYVSLRYCLGGDIIVKVKKLAHEPAFAEGLLWHVKGRRKVYRSVRPTQREVLDPQFPEKSVLYYYQVRSNVVHRGKSVLQDHETVMKSLTELLPIFRGVLKAAEREAQNEMGLTVSRSVRAFVRPVRGG